MRFVSIHTPTKGVTCYMDLHAEYTSVSIHTPTKGVTRRPRNYRVWGFVSIHTPTKGVTTHFCIVVYFLLVSIHTPTKGVTSLTTLGSIIIVCFNPHTHEGCDRRSGWMWLGQSRFNPHTHEGCDHTYEQVVTAEKSFNPHTHEGCDCTAMHRSGNEPSFNPHTHEGCDLMDRQYGKPQQFQSTHPRRVWRNGTRPRTRNGRFNPHTHEGCDLVENPVEVLVVVSIHTPTKGVTAYSANGWISRCKDNDFAKDGKIITHKLL